MAGTKDVGPLDWRVSIVDKQGRPSPEFQRRWNQNRTNTDNPGGNSITFGNGPPSGTPSDGEQYVNVLTTPYTYYVGQAGAWHAVGTANANPSALAKETAVNGVASTYMRSDAAPAVQKATSSLFGIVKVDGITITATSGVISAAPGFGQAWLPLVAGDDLGTPITDGAGSLVTVPYAP